uniref:Uncharacterized protein n=1 Tax=Oryza nivara TaxID=4536 RepID=A0A0E0I7Z7_ORYNI
MKRGGRQAREIPRSTEMASSSSMKQEKDNTIIVLALAAPGSNFRPPQTRKRNRTSSSNGAKSKVASTTGYSGPANPEDMNDVFEFALNNSILDL